MNEPSRSFWLPGVLLLSALLAACGSAQSRKAAYIQHGMQYFNAGNYDKARVEFSNAAQIDPKDAHVHYLLGEVAERLGDARAAAGQYQAAINEDPSQSEARASLARLFLYAGLADKALELAEPGLASDPNNAQLLTVRGAARSQLGDAKAAMQDALQALKLAPSDVYAIALVASLYRKEAHYDQATAVVQAGLQRLPKAVDLHQILADLELQRQRPGDAEMQLRQIVELEPTVLVHRYQLARFYVLQKNIDAAEQTLRDTVAKFPADTDAKLRLVAFLTAQRGRDRAVAQIDQFLAREPDNDGLQLTLGAFLAQIQQPERAERVFRAVMKRAGTHPQGLAARDQLAALLANKGDTVGAGALIAQVLQENPHDNNALVLRAELALAHGDAANAIADLRSVLRDQPNAVPLMRTLARAYFTNGETGLAEETLRGAVQIAPRDFQSRLTLADVLVSTHKSEQAEPLLEQLAKENPSDITVQETLFRAQSEQKQYDAARATAQNIEHLDPKRAIGWYLQGLVDQASGQPEVAADDYQQALQLEPDSGEPLTALARLDLSRKQPAAALARVQAVIDRSPGNGIARNLKAELLVDEGKDGAAVAAYEDAIQAAPSWAVPYHGLAVTQLRAKQSDAAIQTLLRGISRVSGANALLTDLGGLYVQLGRPEDAIALYQRLLDRDPKSIFAANNLAMLLVNYRHDSSSLAQAQRLADQLGASAMPTVIDTRGWVKFKSGDFHGAESLLQQAVDKSPDAPELRYHLAMAQLRSGEQQAAQQNLESALHSAQQFAGSDEARTTLAQLQKGRPAG